MPAVHLRGEAARFGVLGEVHGDDIPGREGAGGDNDVTARSEAHLEHSIVGAAQLAGRFAVDGHAGKSHGAQRSGQRPGGKSLRVNLGG